MPQTLTIIQRTTPLADPHVLSDHRDRRSLLGALYEALVRRERSGFAPALARSWHISADARTWRFELRPNVRFHDGSTLAAADVVASLERALDPSVSGELGTQGVYRSYLANAELRALDDHTMLLVAPAPIADLLDLLADIPIAPRAALPSLLERPVGSGPYRLSHAAEEWVEMDAFAEHWAGAPTHLRLVWLAEPNAAARLDAVTSGRADLACDIAPGSVGPAGIAIVSRPSPLCVIFMANCFAGPCADARVRQALNYALDVPALIDAVAGGAARRLAGPITALHFGHDPATPPYRHDPARARSLLATAGYPNGLELAIDLPTVLPDEAIPLTERMAACYARVGIRTSLRQHTDRPAYAEMVRAKQIGDLCCFDSSPLSTYRVLREKLDSRWRGPWWQGYTNPAVDTLIEQAAATPEADTREALYRRIYRLVHEDAPWVFLYHPTLLWANGPHATGWSITPEGRIAVQ
jgi:peptide/nickel transport system substrate-binding protein